jgi:glycosyltransferase involved in cell wall biosynthesis
MKIVIATGIYPPQVGGPALYAKQLAHALHTKGHVVPVVTYGRLMHFPTGVRHVAYLFRLVPRLWRADACIALDTFSVGLPALIACALMRVPLFVRTGGDFLWESYIERTNDPLPLSSFYTEHKPFSFREKIVFAVTRFVVQRAHMIFSTAYQRDIWIHVYGIKKTGDIIANAIGELLPSFPPQKKNFLWYVRPIAVKNPERTHRAFAQAQKKFADIILEEGRVSHDALLRTIQSCYAVVLPSISEISPNYILDALRCRKPFILTKESGYAEWLAPYGRLIDPRDEEDMTRAFEELASPEGYREACEKVERFNETRTYADVAEEFLMIIDSV